MSWKEINTRQTFIFKTWNTILSNVISLFVFQVKAHSQQNKIHSVQDSGLASLDEVTIESHLTFLRLSLLLL